MRVQQNIESLIVLFGKPGCGKNTMVRTIQSMLSRVHPVSTGDICRERAKIDPAVHALLKAGKLVPDEIIIQCLDEVQIRPEMIIVANGWPRTPPQAKSLRGKFEEHSIVTFHLDIPDKHAYFRMRKRKDVRDDNSPSAILKRLRDYAISEKEILGILSECGRVFKIDTSKSSNEVEAAVEEIFTSRFSHLVSSDEISRNEGVAA